MRLLASLRSPNRQLSLTALIVFAFITQLLGAHYLWGHQSDSGEFLGRYSFRYALGLIANVGLVIFWAFVLLRRKPAETWLRNLTFIQRMRIVILPGAAIAVLWLFPVEAAIKQYIALNWLLLTACAVYTMPDQETRRRLRWAAPLILAALFIPSLITVLTSRSYSPDEAMWADFATSSIEAGGIYARTWLQEPVTISPGVGWSVAGYGWLLDNVAFNNKIGRLWNFYFYLLAFVGVGAVTWRLYGRQAAAVSVTFAILGFSFIPVFDYRPDHQLPAAAMLIMFAALQARYSKQYRGFWDFVCGLAATLSMQLHAAGIVLAFGFSLYYLAELVLTAYRERRITNIRPLLWFGAGALLGTIIYYSLNIVPVGGLQAYLQFLINTRYRSARILRFLTWPSPLLEGAVVLAALLYAAWRRSAADRKFLGMLICVILGILLLDTVGYSSTFSAFYVIPVGALVTDALRNPQIPSAGSLRRVILALALLVMLTGQWAGEFISWPAVQYTIQAGELPPFLYEELRPQLLPLLRDDDVVASTHQLIWTIPHKPQLIFVGSEYTAMTRWNLTDRVDVWERVKPTVVVNVANQMTIEKGLQTYIDRHHFVVCKILTVLNVEVRVLRENCATDSHP